VDAKTGEFIAHANKDYTHGVIDSCLPNGNTKIGNDWALQHPWDYIEVLEDTIPGVMQRSYTNASDVVGLAVDFTGCTLLPVDASLTPLCIHERFKSNPHAYVKLWKHHSAKDQAQQIDEVLKKQGILNEPRYGGRVSSELMLPKILQILQEDPIVFEAADQFLESMDWLSQLLTGKTKRSVNPASYKVWWQPESGGYPEDVFTALDPRLTNLARQQLRGDMCPVGEKFGCLNETWAKRLGLLAGTAVGCGILDSHAAVPGCGITEPGRMLIIIGTSSVQIVLSEKPYSSKGVLGGVKSGIIPGYYALETGLAAVGDIFEWFILNSVPNQYRLDAKAAGKNIYKYLADLGNQYSPGQSGLLALDWWNGNKTPFVNANLSGIILGLNMATKPEEIYRALVEATGFSTRVIMEQFESAGLHIRDIVACGGIAEKDPFLMQIFSDITNREIKMSASEQTAALGAAIYASVAAGAEYGGYDSVVEASSAMSRIQEYSYKPNPANAEIYSHIYDKFKELIIYFGEKNDIMSFLRKFR
jgi:L-ribulokinase